MMDPTHYNYMLPHEQRGDVHEAAHFWQLVGRREDLLLRSHCEVHQQTLRIHTLQAVLPRPDSDISDLCVTIETWCEGCSPGHLRMIRLA